MYWAEALAAQEKSSRLKEFFTPIAEALAANEETIVGELKAVQGNSVDIGGYYRPDDALASSAMRPSATLNAIIDGE